MNWFFIAKSDLFRIYLCSCAAHTAYSYFNQYHHYDDGLFNNNNNHNHDIETIYIGYAAFGSWHQTTIQVRIHLNKFLWYDLMIVLSKEKKNRPYLFILDGANCSVWLYSIGLYICNGRVTCIRPRLSEIACRSDFFLFLLLLLFCISRTICALSIYLLYIVSVRYCIFKCGFIPIRKPNSIENSR